MNDRDLQPFLDAIRDAAAEKCRIAEEETAAYIKTRSEQAEQEAQRRYEEQCREGVRRVKRQADAELAAYRAASRERMSQLRAAYEQTVFSDAARQLEKFAATPAYADWLERAATALAQRFKGYDLSQTVLYLREQDFPLAQRVKTAFGLPCEIRTDSTIRLGGLRMESPSAFLTADDTLEARLEQQKPAFRRTAGLDIV